MFQYAEIEKNVIISIIEVVVPTIIAGTFFVKLDFSLGTRSLLCFTTTRTRRTRITRRTRKIRRAPTKIYQKGLY